MPIRFGFAGLDHWYNAFPTLDALAAHPDAAVVALAHRDAARAEEVGRRYGVRVLPSYDDVIARDDIDAVCSFLSTDENPEVCIRAAEAGKAVVAIKPMALNLATADRVVETVRRRGVHYFPNDAARRFMPAVVQFRTWISEGRIGDVVAGHCVFRAGLPQEWPGATIPGWFADPTRAPGGAFIDHAIYHIDVLRWLLGAEVTEAGGMVANVRHKDIPVEDWGHGVFRFANGTAASIEDTWTSGPGASREAIEIVGTRGALGFDTSTGKVALTGDFGIGGWLLTNPPAPGGNTFIGHVIRVLKGEEAPASSAEESRANLAACLAFYVAARTGRTTAPSVMAVRA